jgi:hypothetical protein
MEGKPQPTEWKVSPSRRVISLLLFSKESLYYHGLRSLFPAASLGGHDFSPALFVAVCVIASICIARGKRSHLTKNALMTLTRLFDCPMLCSYRHQGGFNMLHTFYASPHRVPSLLAIVFAIGLIGGCSQKSPTAPAGGAHFELERLSPRDASNYDAGVAAAWFKLAYGAAQTERLTPPVASRAFGYAGVALYEAVVPGMHGHQSLAGQLDGLAAMPHVGGKGLHWPTVANSVMATVMKGLFASASAPTIAAIAALEDQFAGEFEGEVSPGVFALSKARGEAVGEAILEWSRSDGYAEFNNCAFTPPTGAGLWVPTPPAFAPPLQPCWGDLRPFAIAEGSVCNPGPPPAFSEDPSSQFFQEAKEVFDVCASLTDDQRTIALFWADGAGTLTPPGHSISIATQALENGHHSLAVAAETYARVGMAVSDAFIACWWTKYEYNLLRPITCIRPLFDAAWVSPIGTPPFPEYTSGHSTQSGAAAQVLTDLFGDVAFTDHTHDARGLSPRPFSSFFEAAEEAAISRLYGGIHFRAAIELGIEQGICIGQHVSALQFRKRLGT